ncbi:MAG TPA: hypothetical protein VFU89_00715 [Rhabdochlamydiaceae bacterium]|nr:hypothetical protein [Rhabdochlamydiaceae bacterium]
MKKWIKCFIVLILINCNLVARPDVTVWVRSFGESSAQIIRPYLEQIEKELSTDFELHILVATKPQDPVLNALQGMKINNHLTVLQTRVDSVSTGINELTKATPEGRYVLSLSQGVNISARNVRDALAFLNADDESYAYGWELSNMHNKGARPGEGWYHTAVLYPPKTISWMKEHLLPDWVDNGVAGSILVEEESIPLGGNEEVVVMGRISQEFPKAIFFHNIRDILDFSRETGTCVSFKQKMKRKAAVADYYLTKQLKMDPNQVWEHLFLIK